MRQVRQFKLLKQYKFIIYYTSRKNNGRADALNKKPDYITTKKILHIINKKNGTFTNATTQLNAIININNKKTIKKKNNKKIISEQKINDYIRKYHDPPKFGHPNMNSTTAILRKNCYFKNIQARVQIYIEKCKSCQQNKYSIYIKFGSRKTILLPDGSQQEIIINFIIKLPKSRDPITGIQYNSI